MQSTPVEMPIFLAVDGHRVHQNLTPFRIHSVTLYSDSVFAEQTLTNLALVEFGMRERQ
jgi:hypothetical protein